MIDERREARPTAYVLGEMTEQERAAFEAELAKDGDLRAEVDGIREVAALLEKELSGTQPVLAPAAIERLEAAARVAPKRARWGLYAGAGLSMAAAVSLWFVQAKEAPESSSAAARGDLPMEVAQAAATAAPAAAPVAAEARKGKPMAAKVAAGRMAAPGRASKEADEHPRAAADGNRYETLDETPFLSPTASPLSTFSIDVDTASYALLRTYLQGGVVPPPGVVRIEEMINYFSYSYAEPTDGTPFRVNLDLGVAPWAPSHRLVRVAIKGKTVEMSHMDGVNLVFLIDSSGSMSAPKKMPLVKQSMRMLVGALAPSDRVGIVTYAGSAGLVLPSTPVSDKDAVLSAIDHLEAGGSTNGGAGIQLAYDVAGKALLKGGVNRVILATDGDFNVGMTSDDALVELIQQKAKSGVFLSVLGFGMGNLNDALLQKIANKGNGQYAYIDDEQEAKRALVDGLGTLIPIAKDVKIQVELNPALVERYRLVGYEKRMMAARDFHDDRKDAGDLGSGHTVTALYELVPKNGAAPGGALLTTRLRYKAPDGNESKLIEQALQDREVSLASMSPDFKFAAAVASFGMLLRRSTHAGNATYDAVIELAEPCAGDDPKRREMIELVRRAKATPGR